MKQFILEFEHRDDGGPRHVGTFTSRGDAITHIEWLGLNDSMWAIRRLVDPGDDIPRVRS